MAHSISYFRYWGKTNKKDEPGVAYHLLPWHCLDAAAVAAYWWDHSISLRQSFCHNQSTSETEVRAWLLFFIAMHDLGKWDIRFQCKVTNSWLALHPEDRNTKLPGQGECRHFDHGAAGLFWFIDDYQPAEVNYGYLDFGEQSPHPYFSWIPWVEAVAGHHGYIRRETHISADQYKLQNSSCTFSARDTTARKEWINTLESLFLIPAGLSVNNTPPTVSPLLAGFCSVSDWLGSWCSDGTFQYCAMPPENNDELQRYFTNKCVPRASGDKPLQIQLRFHLRMCSPRQRG